jgi:hypothetical protein
VRDMEDSGSGRGRLVQRGANSATRSPSQRRPASDVNP